MSVDGTWTITMKTPLGAQAATVKMSANGRVLAGTFDSKLGAGELMNGSVDGSKVTWSIPFKLPIPGTAHFSATIDGDAMSGTLIMGRLGPSSFKGARG